MISILEDWVEARIACDGFGFGAALMKLASRYGCGIESTLNSQDELRFSKRLLNHYRAGSADHDAGRIAGDEDVRDKCGAKYFIDGRDATSIGQSYIHDQEVRPASKGGGHHIALGGLDRANVVPHLFEYLGEQQTNQGIVFGNKDAEAFHQLFYFQS